MLKRSDQLRSVSFELLIGEVYKEEKGELRFFWVI
jgi:hypothetical protein